MSGLGLFPPTRKLLRLVAALCLVAGLSSAPSRAQVAGGTIEGIITDPSGAVISGAHVTVTDPVTGVSRSSVTNAAGHYALANLPPSTYSLTVEVQGFSPRHAGNIELTVGRTLEESLALSVSASSENVEVLDTAARVDLDDASLNELVDSETIRELPLNKHIDFA